MSVDATGKKKYPPGQVACGMFMIAGLVSVVAGVAMVFLGIWTDPRWVWTGIATIVVAAVDIVLAVAVAYENDWFG